MRSEIRAGGVTEAVHEVDHRLDAGPRRLGPMSVKSERARLQEEPSELPRIVRRRRQRRDAAEARPHEPAAGGAPLQRIARLERRHQLLAEEPAVVALRGIVPQALARLGQGDDHRRHFQTVNEVVEHCLEHREMQIVEPSCTMSNDSAGCCGSAPAGRPGAPASAEAVLGTLSFSSLPGRASGSGATQSGIR